MYMYHFNMQLFKVIQILPNAVYVNIIGQMKFRLISDIGPDHSSTTSTSVLYNLV